MGSGATEEAKKEQLGAVAIKPPGWDRTRWDLVLPKKRKKNNWEL